MDETNAYQQRQFAFDTADAALIAAGEWIEEHPELYIEHIVVEFTNDYWAVTIYWQEDK